MCVYTEAGKIIIQESPQGNVATEFAGKMPADSTGNYYVSPGLTGVVDILGRLLLRWIITAPTRTSSDTFIVIGHCGLCSLAQSNSLNIDRLTL